MVRRRQGSRMFARYFVELPLPADDVEHALSRDPRGWIPGLAEQANFKGDRLLAEVGFGEAIRLRRNVIVEIGKPIHASSKSFFPLRWTASGHAGLFPALDADIEVASLGSDRAQLAISATVRPSPRGGRPNDRSSAPLPCGGGDGEGLPRSDRRHHHERANHACLLGRGPVGPGTRGLTSRDDRAEASTPPGDAR